MSTAPAASASGAGWRQNLGHALMATVLTAIVVTPIFGLHLERAGVRTHIVPRWETDANFFPIIAKTKALPQLLGEVRQAVADAWPTTD